MLRHMMLLNIAYYINENKAQLHAIFIVYAYD